MEFCRNSVLDELVEVAQAVEGWAMTTLSVSDEAEMRAAFDLVTIKDVDGACLVRKTLVTLDDLNVDASVLREVPGTETIPSQCMRALNMENMFFIFSLV